jgi:glycosyltransferase involved in cell wall biosynthesis
VTYWTGVWDPRQEAISKEVIALRATRPTRPPVVAFAPNQRPRFSFSERVFVLPGRSWLSFRAAAALLERQGDVTHVFGGTFSWHMFKALGRRPILFTAVVAPAGSVAHMTTQPAAVVVESEAAVQHWIDAGVPRSRVQVVRPGVDLDRFRPLGRPESARFALLFASTPSDPAEIGPRGIPLLVDLARARPDLDVLVPWRRWGDLGRARRTIDDLNPPANFLVAHEGIADMTAWYARAHATVACFAPGVGKSVPTFLLEGLASGRPFLTTCEGVASAARDASAGIMVEPTVASLSSAADRLRDAWAEFSVRARVAAEQYFDVTRFLRQYETLYDDVARASARRSVTARTS